MMKTVLTICLTVFLVFGFSGILVAEEIPGGIVYSNGKSAIYYDFSGEQEMNLTADLSGIIIKEPLAVSEDGLMLIWLDNDNRFWFRRFPNGKPYPATVKKDVNTKKINKNCSISDTVYVPMPPIQQKEIGNLTLSPESPGSWWSSPRFSYESTEESKEWVLVEPGKSITRRVQQPNDCYPKYDARIDEFNAVTILHSTDGLMQRYGHTGFYPPTFPIRTTYKSPEETKRAKAYGFVGDSAVTYLTTPDIVPGLTLPVKDACQKFSVKQNAHFLTWQKSSNWSPSNQFFALIYQTADGWGPIEIHNTIRGIFRPLWTKPGNERETIKDKKPTVYEIPVSLNSCDGLAWKPDGSLTYLSEGKVFLLDERQIRQDIENSGIAENPYPDSYTPVPVNNVFTINSELVATGIHGDRLHWVSNDTFLFRGEESSLKNIYSWHQGNIKRLCPAPKEFSYCDQPPFGFSIVSGKATVNSFVGSFCIGDIKTRIANTTGAKDGAYIYIEDPLEYAFPEEISLERIKNPADYTYKKCELNERIQRKGPPLLAFLLKNVLILKSGEKYAAIKPLSLELTWKTWEEVPADYKKGIPSQVMRNSKPDWFESMTYEWKYWPAGSFESDDGKKKELTRDSWSPTSGKAEALENPDCLRYSIAWNGFYVVAGDIKTGWEAWSATSLFLLIAPLPDGSRCEYALLLPGLELEAIADPSALQYQKSPDNSTHTCRVAMDRIIVLKVGDRYAAIKPLSIGEVSEELRNELLIKLNVQSPQPNGKSLTYLAYEWKYWHKIPSGTPTDLTKIGSLVRD